MSALDVRLARAIFVATFALYLLSSGREPPWGDGNVQYMVAEGLVHRGTLAIPKAWPDDLPHGRNGHYYSTYPLVTSLVQVPGVLVLDAVTWLVPGARTLAKPLTSHLACSALGALTCALFFVWCRDRRLSRRAASAATAILAVGTTVWVYAHYSYSEIAQAAFFLGLVRELLRVRDQPVRRRAVWLGVLAGLLFSVKYIYAAALVGAALYLVLGSRRTPLAAIGRPAQLRLALIAGLAALPFLVLALIYNALCWGSPLGTGYAPYFATYWGENPMVGLWGMWLSPGKSVFLYSPPLVLGLAALPRLWRDHRAVCLAVIAAGAPVVAVYSRYKLNGDYAWGPRFLVFLVPVLSFGFAVLLDRRSRFAEGGDLRPATAVRWARRGAVAAVIAAGVAVQLLGNAFYWDHFIRISMDARQAWLGQPNRSGAIIPVRGDGHCDSCFEDIHQLEWLPPFQPIRGHLWLLCATLAGDDAKAAEARAPWHDTTQLAVELSNSYPRVRIDWWGLLWINDAPGAWPSGLVVLIGFAAGAGLGLRGWRRALRASEDS